MALRAGYYGLKKKFIGILNKWDQIVFTREDQAILGAVNVALFVDNKNVGVDGTITDVSGRIATVQPISIIPGATYRYVTKADTPTPPCIYAVWNGVTLVRRESGLENGSILNTAGGDRMYVGAYSSASITVASAKAMVVLSDTPVDNYIGPAMTNQELTTSAADQKTAINAIITAATGAADFAAFKTAMGAITPVTRSLSLTKEDITEEVKEDVEPEKTVTKKRTTKKTEEV